ncbi:uncharacterized protein LOC129585611 [Paramacrobiotus metropolitanus]|uniref:uncharacterized protein LOC129585611 n=1 Tax=Paramacrobiotus metropolitanus TaxID=2943436 RepID=UPI002445B83A|nr:uncharacterized protein LOC129585611 [Paramacrobiotus metropolitanus]
MRYFQLDSNDTSNWMKFVRFAVTPEEQNVVVYEAERNDQSADCSSSVILVTTRAIAEHGELKIGYSVDYARIIDNLSQERSYEKTEKRAAGSVSQMRSVSPTKRLRRRPSNHDSVSSPDGAVQHTPTTVLPAYPEFPPSLRLPSLPIVIIGRIVGRRAMIPTNPMQKRTQES